MKRLIEDQEDTIRQLKENVQKLKDQLDDATERIEALNKKKEEKNKTIDDQVKFTLHTHTANTTSAFWQAFSYSHFTACFVV